MHEQSIANVGTEHQAWPPSAALSSWHTVPRPQPCTGHGPFVSLLYPFMLSCHPFGAASALHHWRRFSSLLRSFCASTGSNSRACRAGECCCLHAIGRASGAAAAFSACGAFPCCGSKPPGACRPLCLAVMTYTLGVTMRGSPSLSGPSWRIGSGIACAAAGRIGRVIWASGVST